MARQDTVEAAVADFLERAWPRPSGTILVAVSGGADSVSLLQVLHALGVSLAVAHFDHQTRCGASAEDAAFVSRMAEELSVPCFVGTAPVAAVAKEAGTSFEQEARRQRYRFLLETAHQRAIGAIATGHTWDDQAETVLLRVLRGAGPSGLGGIPPLRDEDGVRLLRPLLEVRRDALRGWLEARGIGWREDATNVEPGFLRNRVRNELLPLLRSQYNPAVDEALVRLALAQRDENDLMDPLAREAAGRVLRGPAILRGEFRSLHVALQRRALLQFAWEHGFDCTFDQVQRGVEFVCGAPTGKILDWAANFQLFSGRELTELLPARREHATNVAVTLDVPGEAQFQESHFGTSILAEGSKDLRVYCTANRQVFDLDRLALPLQIRTRRAGDRLVPLGMEGSRKLSDLLIDLGVPAQQRDSMPLLLDEEKIIWVVGRAVSGLAAVTPLTRRVVQVEVSHETE
ncbi:MAG: tRNA lysidine(34) synthetase TilS [Candidatus Hydrogenedentes bacterium]|nr:tRNA lysidine(34) synthetase TilS [Candidatus Hydrogenedentota bacterium]